MPRSIRNRPPRMRQAPEVVHFQPPSQDILGVETLTLTQLRERGSAAHLAAVQRLEFMMFVLYTRGRGAHVVDFVRHRVRAGTLIVVQPGGLHQFRLNESLDGRLLVADPRFMLPDRLSPPELLHARADWPACAQLLGPLCQELLLLCDALQRDTARQVSRELRRALARQRLYTWLTLVRIAWDAGAGRPQPPPGLICDFQDLLEQHYAKRWTVQDYARKLGYAQRTLTRACLAFKGQTAKAMIDARLALEAKRLLAYTDDSVRAIGQRLGFDDSSTMIQFFRRAEGATPEGFRRAFRMQG